MKKCERDRINAKTKTTISMCELPHHLQKLLQSPERLTGRVVVTIEEVVEVVEPLRFRCSWNAERKVYNLVEILQRLHLPDVAN